VPEGAGAPSAAPGAGAPGGGPGAAAAPTVETLRVLHRTIAEVGEDMQAMRINTAIAKLIVLNNHLTSLPAVPRTVAEQLVLMTAPVAPHLAEELWSRLGHERSLAHEPFPAVDPQYLVQDSVTCVFQVQGKVRGRAEVAPDADEATLRELALADAGVQRALAGRDVRTVIVRAPKLRPNKHPLSKKCWPWKFL
jgi:leucyl-tRNA synthetase